MADEKIPIVQIDSWRADESIDKKLNEKPQPAIVIVGGVMYVLNNAQVEREIFIAGGVQQYFMFNIQGLSDAKGNIGTEVMIGVEKMQEMIDEYKGVKEGESDE